MPTRLETLRTRSAELSAIKQLLEQKIIAAQAEEQEALYAEVQQTPTKKPGAIDSPAGKIRRKRIKLISELEAAEENLRAVNRVLGEEAEVEVQKTRAEDQKKFDAWNSREKAAWEAAGEKFAALHDSWRALQAVLAGRSGPPFIQFEHAPTDFEGFLRKLVDATLDLQARGHYQVNKGFVEGMPLRHADFQDRLVKLLPDLTTEGATNER